MRITSETRLKHRDRIRLHKFEFDFVMPDLEEAGMTKVSHTVYAGAADESGSDMDDIKPGISGKAVGLDFDFSGADPVGEARSSKTEDETLLPGYDSDAFDATDMPDDETLMPAPDVKAGKPERARAAVVNKSPVIVPDDETLMPGHFDDTDDEATIRPGRNSSSSDVFDVTGSDDKD